MAIALQQLADNMTEGTGVETEVVVIDIPELASDLELDLYRLAQEAITNILRHAQATKIVLSLICKPNLVELQIKDNGIGGMATIRDFYSHIPLKPLYRVSFIN